MSVFWGVEVKPGKPYKHSVSEDDLLEGSTLHLSQATLGLEGKSKERAVVKCKVGNKPELLLCSLIPNVLESCSLDLLFDEDVTFSVVGNSSVHLIGYYMPLEDDENEDDDYAFGGSSEEESEESEDEEDDEEDDSDMEDDEERTPSSVRIEEVGDEEMPSPSPVKLLKGKGEESQTAQKKRKKTEELAKKAQEPAKETPASGDKSEDEDGFAQDTPPPKKQAVAGVDGAATPAAAATPESGKKKKNKKKKNKNKEQQTPGSATPASPAPAATPEPTKQGGKSVENGAGKTPANTPATNGATPAAGRKDAKKGTPVVKKFPNGLELHEVAMGKPDAKQAQSGKKVGMIYTGKLKSNGKVFDSNVGKKPFEFRLGVGEVIKGWDVGVNGMRVGDKRKLIIPPEMAYGSKGVPGTIPGNSTLEFDVELVNVK
ncbi:hypothetical protein R1flu_028526 [Riccia fluitans]|uniref:peptidylprolyl isomerase n=1 Tax=Riccia fluitans TaxID=41844 RepID=A0ABD1XLY0_9MARC